MEEPQRHFVSEDAQEKILEKENNFEVIMEQQQPTKDSAEPSTSSGCESTTKTESDNQVRSFVTLLTFRVLTKCHALQNRGLEECVNHTKTLVNQTLEGLALTEGFCPDVKSTKKVCKTVLKDLAKKFCGRRQLESMILLQDPAVDKVIVQSLQAHIKEFSARCAKKAASRSLWKDVLHVLAISAGSLATICLMIVIV
ncbi:hypothetical protein PAMP_019346 [Pampus punctatissimus]